MKYGVACFSSCNGQNTRRNFSNNKLKIGKHKFRKTNKKRGKCLDKCCGDCLWSRFLEKKFFFILFKLVFVLVAVHFTVSKFYDRKTKVTICRRIMVLADRNTKDWF